MAAIRVSRVGFTPDLGYDHGCEKPATNAGQIRREMP
jgi:hypothetical protein